MCGVDGVPPSSPFLVFRSIALLLSPTSKRAFCSSVIQLWDQFTDAALNIITGNSTLRTLARASTSR